LPPLPRSPRRASPLSLPSFPVLGLLLRSWVHFSPVTVYLLFSHHPSPLLHIPFCDALHFTSVPAVSFLSSVVFVYRQFGFLFLRPPSLWGSLSSLFSLPPLGGYWRTPPLFLFYAFVPFTTYSLLTGQTQKGIFMFILSFFPSRWAVFLHLCGNPLLCLFFFFHF